MEYFHQHTISYTEERFSSLESRSIIYPLSPVWFVGQISRRKYNSKIRTNVSDKACEISGGNNGEVRAGFQDAFRLVETRVYSRVYAANPVVDTILGSNVSGKLQMPS